MSQNINYDHWEGTKGPCLCLVSKLLFFGLFDWFPLFLHFLTSLIKLILWLKFSTHIGQAEDMMGGDKDHRSCSVSPWYEAVTYIVWPAHKLSRKWGSLPVLSWSSQLFFEERREVLSFPSYRRGDQGHTWSWVWNPDLLIHRVMFLSPLHLLVPGDSFPSSTISWAPHPTPTHSPPTAELRRRIQKKTETQSSSKWYIYGQVTWLGSGLDFLIKAKGTRAPPRSDGLRGTIWVKAHQHKCFHRLGTSATRPPPPPGHHYSEYQLWTSLIGSLAKCFLPPARLGLYELVCICSGMWSFICHLGEVPSNPSPDDAMRVFCRCDEHLWSVDVK